MEESRGSPIGKCTRTRISHDNCITALVNGYPVDDRELQRELAGEGLGPVPARLVGGLAGSIAALRDRPASPPRRSHRVGPPAACLPEKLALEPPVATTGPDHLREADQCGGCGGGVGPELRGGPALAASAGASGGEPGWGQDPHPPTSQEGAAGPATLEGIAPSSQEEKVHGVTRRPCSIEHSVQIEHDHSMTDRDHVALATVSSFN